MLTRRCQSLHCSCAIVCWHLGLGHGREAALIACFINLGLKTTIKIDTWCIYFRCQMPICIGLRSSVHPDCPADRREDQGQDPRGAGVPERGLPDIFHHSEQECPPLVGLLAAHLLSEFHWVLRSSRLNQTNFFLNIGAWIFFSGAKIAGCWMRRTCTRRTMRGSSTDTGSTAPCTWLKPPGHEQSNEWKLWYDDRHKTCEEVVFVFLFPVRTLTTKRNSNE